MESFIAWHYSDGLAFFIKRWHVTLSWINHNFSLPLLISSLFSTWKRLIDTGNTGLNFGKYFEKFMFNLVSRMVGAGVRLTLFVFGIFLLVLTFLAGGFGIIIWLVFPLMGYPFYTKYKRQPKQIANLTKSKIKSDLTNQVTHLFESEAGRFIISHIGLTIQDVVKNSKVQGDILDAIPLSNFTDLIKIYTKAQFLEEDFLQKTHITYDDFVHAASWWDEIQSENNDLGDEEGFGKPGIGLELLFGYTPTLNKFGIDLAAPQSFSHHLIGRGEVVSRIERSLSGGNSVVIVGQPGVGKKTVVLEFAHQASIGMLGSAMAYRRVIELDYTALFANCPTLDLKKAAITSVLAEAASAGNVILVIRDVYKLTNASLEGLDFTDIFEKYLEKKDLKIITVVTRVDYERFVAANMRLRKFLDTVEIAQPTPAEALEILISSAKVQEIRNKLIIGLPALRAILEGSDRFISETPFPEKAIELLDAVVTYKLQSGGNFVTPTEVNKVLSERTGVSFASLSATEREQLANLEEIIHQNLVNQKSAVSLIAKSLRSRHAGVRDEGRPVGSFMFLGPTGVGKTQTAKVLAKVYFGSENQILRFDMAEFASKEGITRLIGSMENNVPGALTTSIKNKPASLLLLDEIEKAPKEIYNLLLTLLDEGYITDAFGRKIDCRHLFVIATSNAGAEFIREKVAGGISSVELQKQVLEHIQTEKFYSPEFLNRFDGVVVFEPLNKEQLVSVAKLQLGELAKNLKKQNIFLQITDELAQKVVEDGYNAAFGARQMRRVIDLTLGDIIGKAILKSEIMQGDVISITPTNDPEGYKIQKTPKASK